MRKTSWRLAGEYMQQGKAREKAWARLGARGTGLGLGMIVIIFSLWRPEGIATPDAWSVASLSLSPSLSLLHAFIS